MSPRSGFIVLHRCLRAAILLLFLSSTTAGVMAIDKLPETNGRTVTSWIPMTTAYPSQSGCSDIYWSYVPNTIAAWDPGYGISVQDLGCQPKAVTTWWDAERLGTNELTTLSLGPLTCPQAYFTAAKSTKDASSTFVACCPLGYTFIDFHDPGRTGECVSNVNPGKVLTYAVRDDAGNWQHNTTSIATATTVAGIQINGWVFAEATAAAAAPSVSGENGGLSSGAKIGIAVGVTFGAIGLGSLAAGIWLLVLARRGRRVVAPGGNYAGLTMSMTEDSRQQQHPPGGGPTTGLSNGGSSPSGPPSPTYGGSNYGQHPTGAAFSYHTQGSYANHSVTSHGPPGSTTAGFVPHGGSHSELAGGHLHPSRSFEPVPPLPVQPVDATELPSVSSPVLHPGDLQPQGYGPKMWKPGAVYG